MRNRMEQFAIARPKKLIGAADIITILFGSQLPTDLYCLREIPIP